MIREGSHGSMCFYYKGLLISGFPLNKTKNEEQYLYQGDYIIQKSRGINIKNQLKAYHGLCNMIYTKKLNKEKISREDHVYFVSCLCALLRLRVIDNDNMNGYYCFPKKH